MNMYNKKRLHSTIGYQAPNNLDSKGEKLLPEVS